MMVSHSETRVVIFVDRLACNIHTFLCVRFFIDTQNNNVLEGLWWVAPAHLPYIGIPLYIHYVHVHLNNWHVLKQKTLKYMTFAYLYDYCIHITI